MGVNVGYRGGGRRSMVFALAEQVLFLFDLLWFLAQGVQKSFVSVDSASHSIFRDSHAKGVRFLYGSIDTAPRLRVAVG